VSALAPIVMGRRRKEQGTRNDIHRPNVPFDNGHALPKGKEQGNAGGEWVWEPESFSF